MRFFGRRPSHALSISLFSALISLKKQFENQPSRHKLEL